MILLNRLVKFSFNKHLINEFINNKRVNLILTASLLKNNILASNDAVYLYSSSSQQQFKLVEVGILNKTKPETYQVGQLFLHKLLSYRGVILFPWTANLFDKNDDLSFSPPQTPANGKNSITNQYDKVTSDELERNGPPERSKAKKITYYQVLVDFRDMPHVRAQPDSVTSVTFLSGAHSSRSVFQIEGVDFVSHSDVLPYTSTEKIPIMHDLFDKFLAFDSESPTSFSAKDPLKAWQDSNHTWLKLTDVFVKTTHNIKVTVIPFYVGIREEQKKRVYFWRYSIRIENLCTTQPVTLRERFWRIFGSSGSFETVRGTGVVGQEPLLNKDYPVFQYSSHVQLQSPSGHMWGTFRMEKEDGTSFEVRIPSFHLESKEEDKYST